MEENLAPKAKMRQYVAAGAMMWLNEQMCGCLSRDVAEGVIMWQRSQYIVS